MASKKKYYVIWNGEETGVFDSWSKVQTLIKGYPGAKYKSFKTKAEAIAAYQGYHGDYIATGSARKSKPHYLDHAEKIEMDSLSVDAACSGNPGDLEYRGVLTGSGEEIFRMGPFKMGTNNIGEFLALVHALALLHQQKDDQTAIYSDSRTAMAWVRNKKVKTTLKKNRSNTSLFKLVDRAVDWIKNHQTNSRILKWNTEEWGEIPADFGRK